MQRATSPKRRRRNVLMCSSPLTPDLNWDIVYFTDPKVSPPDPERNSSTEDLESDDSLEIDALECKTRKIQCLRNLADLEHQFTVLSKQLHKEKLLQVDKQIQEVKTGKSKEYIKSLKRLQENMRVRIKVAGILKTLRLESVKNKFEAENQCAQQDYNNEKWLLSEIMKEEILEKVKKLKEKFLKADVVSYGLDRKRKRRRQVTVSAPYIVYMLSDADIMEDWNFFKDLLERQEILRNSRK